MGWLKNILGDSVPEIEALDVSYDNDESGLAATNVQDAIDEVQAEIEFIDAGDVEGPASATDNAIARFDGTTGKLIQNSGASIDDSGNISATNLSGTNTGNQTSIVGITGTKAEFDTAVTDGNFLYVGDVTQYTDEMAQDAVGNILLDSAQIDFTYDDGTPSITATVIDDSITFAKIVNITDSRLLGRSAGSTGDAMEITVGAGLSLSAGALTSTITQYTDELAQDAVGAMVDSSLVYVDGTPLLTRAALTGDVTASQGSNATTIAADAVTYAKMQNFSAYTIIGNNTNGAANPTEITFRDDFTSGAGTYAGTITWTGTTAPSGALTQQYYWYQSGKNVTLSIGLHYANAGTALTQVTLTLPSDAPAPVEWFGQGAANEVLYNCASVTGTAFGVVGLARSALTVNAADNGYLIQISQQSANTIYALVTAIYRTA